MDGDPSGASAAERLAKLESEFAVIKGTLGELTASRALELRAGDGRDDRLSLLVFSGSLDRLIAAFVLATGAAAMGMKVSMFFTFWGTSALRRDAARVEKTLLERMFGWMLPKGVKKLPLSQMNLGGAGPLMIRHVMKKKGVASVEEMLALSAELGVELTVCSMSMELLGMKEAELVEYPGLSFCGVAKFLETAAPGKLTLFL